MQKPFPELTHLTLITPNKFGPPVLPDLFVGRSVPRLRSLVLSLIPFPGLPNLLSSATHLVELNLYNIPSHGYIQPKSMATSLSALTNLEKLCIWFEIPLHCKDQCPPPPLLTLSILRSLTNIRFQGASKY